MAYHPSASAHVGGWPLSGSSGYGKSFLHKGDKGWGIGPMQHDLTDAVAWAVKEGIALEDKVCIYGGSYGGYACLAGMTFTPDLYACGVDIVGPSNIKTLLDSIPPYWGPLRNDMLLKIGDVDNDVEVRPKRGTRTAEAGLDA